MNPKYRVIALRLVQIVLGVALLLLLSRVLLKQFDGYAKLAFAVIASLSYGYLAVWSNLFIDKSISSFAHLRTRNPNQFGHLAMLLGSFAIGFGFFTRAPIFTLVGGCLFFLANRLLTRVQESPILKVWEEAGREHEKRQIKNLLVTVSAEQQSQNDYKVTVKNSGKIEFKKLRVIYEPLLLDAESFGIDTTHMPSKDARIAGDPIQIESLQPNQSVDFVRRGWDDSSRFLGSKQNLIFLTFESPTSGADLENPHWCYAKVNLPNARA